MKSSEARARYGCDHRSLKGIPSLYVCHADYALEVAAESYNVLGRVELDITYGAGWDDDPDWAGRLRQDQGWLEENWREVLAQLQPVAQGFGGYDIDMLRHASDVYAALLLEHLALEQGHVFPAARASADTQMKAVEIRRSDSSMSAAA